MGKLSFYSKTPDQTLLAIMPCTFVRQNITRIIPEVDMEYQTLNITISLTNSSFTNILTLSEMGYKSRTDLTGPCTKDRTSGSKPQTSVKFQLAGMPRWETYWNRRQNTFIKFKCRCRRLRSKAGTHLTLRLCISGHTLTSLTWDTKLIYCELWKVGCLMSTSELHLRSSC